MHLNGKQKEEFRNALIKAFPRKSLLEMMLSDELDLDMDSFVYGDSYENLVFELIKWASAKNTLQALLIGSLRKNSGNKELIVFLEKNFQEILYSDDTPIKIDFCDELISIIKRIKDLNLILSCMFQALPDEVKDNNIREIEVLENSQINLIIKIFLISKLLIVSYPYINNCPSVLIFAII